MFPFKYKFSVYYESHENLPTIKLADNIDRNRLKPAMIANPILITPTEDTTYFAQHFVKSKVQAIENGLQLCMPEIEFLCDCHFQLTEQYGKNIPCLIGCICHWVL